ncbi:MAG: hypothetical protein ISS55_10250 [Dehalococcoidales bacterium]|nr:hypothetical protein [Dehalococcoidales bacterium]
MNSEVNGIEQEEQLWYIDIDWFERNARSFSTLAERSLCSKCRKRLKGGKLSDNELFANIKDCCSGTTGFISGATPIMESVFRLFLANGNQALDIIELGRQLSEWRGVDTYRTSIEVLPRLLNHDLYYGIRPVGD